MSPEEKSIDLEQANQRLASMGLSATDKPVRAKRCDKGKPRKPAPEPQAQTGALDDTQADKLCDLLDDVVQAERAYWDAEENRNLAMIAYNAHVESLRKP